MRASNYNILDRICGKDLWIEVYVDDNLNYIRIQDIYYDSDTESYVCLCNYANLSELDMMFMIPSSDELFTDYEYNIDHLNGTEELFVEDIEIASPLEVLTTEEFYEFINNYCREHYPDEDYDGDDE